MKRVSILALCLVLSVGAVSLALGQGDAAPSGSARFAPPVRMKAGDAWLGAKRLYPSPVVHDVDGDRIPDVVVGDLFGKVTVATGQRVDDGGLVLAAEEPLKSDQGKQLKFHNCIGDEVRNKKLPQVVDVRDESTDDVRVVLDLKQGASPEAVMAYLYKRTKLQTTWPVNMTGLLPTANPEVSAPSRLDLKMILEHWLDFRFETIRRRYEFDLAELLARIHILEGFEIVFDALDEAIALIRASEGRRDAHERLIERFDLSDAQAEAILELRLYKLARLEIAAIREELAEKRAEASKIERILASDKRLWKRVRSELVELRELYADARRTEVGLPEKKLEFDEDAYIVKEDTYVVVTRDGWIKRQSSFSAIDKIRVRDGDEIGWLIKAHTRSTVTFFSSAGAAYVMRVDDVPATTGYGEPLQASYAFADGERVVGVISHDARHRPLVQETLLAAPGDDPGPPYGIGLTECGRTMRFQLAAHEEVSTKAGRKFARLNAGDAVFVVYAQADDEQRVAVATRNGRAMLFNASDVPILKAAGKGVNGINTRDGDTLVACELTRGSLQGPTVHTSFGRELVVRERKFGVSTRGGRGKVVLKRGTIDSWARGPKLMLAEDRDEPSSSDAELDDEIDANGEE